MYVHCTWLIDMPEHNKTDNFSCTMRRLYLHCRLLIIFTKRLNLEQAWHNVGPDLGPNCLHPERIFWKLSILKEISRRQKSWKNTPRSTTYLPCRHSLKKRQYDVMTSHWRRYYVVFTSCTCWVWWSNMLGIDRLCLAMLSASFANDRWKNVAHSLFGIVKKENKCILTRIEWQCKKKLHIFAALRVMCQSASLSCVHTR